MQGKIDIIPVIRNLNHWPRFRLRLVAVEGAWVGLLSGIVISFFRWCLEAGTRLREQVYALLMQAGWVENTVWFVFLLMAAYVLYRLKQHEPEGIWQWYPTSKRNHSRRRAAALAEGTLGQAGRRYTGYRSGAVSGTGRPVYTARRRYGPGDEPRSGTVARMEERYLITAGASAGLAAAFNAPLAGAIFALEELHRNFSSVVLAPAMAAALDSTMVSRVVFDGIRFSILACCRRSRYGICG